MDQDEEVEMPKDPRAGCVDVFLPQISIDYEALSKEFFDLGSKDGMKKACRNDLFTLSKMYKDVAGGVFPLGPNINEVEVEIEKVSVKKSTKVLMSDEEKMLKKNKEEKEKARLKETTCNTNGTNEESEEMETDGSGDETAEEPEKIEEVSAEERKARKKEFHKKRKAELRRKKREAIAEMSKANEEKMKNDAVLLEHDLQMKEASEKKSKKKEKRFLEKEVEPLAMNGDHSIEEPTPR